MLKPNDVRSEVMLLQYLKCGTSVSVVTKIPSSLFWHFNFFKKEEDVGKISIFSILLLWWMFLKHSSREILMQKRQSLMRFLISSLVSSFQTRKENWEVKKLCKSNNLPWEYDIPKTECVWQALENCAIFYNAENKQWCIDNRGKIGSPQTRAQNRVLQKMKSIDEWSQGSLKEIISGVMHDNRHTRRSHGREANPHCWSATLSCSNQDGFLIDLSWLTECEITL